MTTAKKIAIKRALYNSETITNREFLIGIRRCFAEKEMAESTISDFYSVAEVNTFIKAIEDDFYNEINFLVVKKEEGSIDFEFNQIECSLLLAADAYGKDITARSKKIPLIRTAHKYNNYIKEEEAKALQKVKKTGKVKSFLSTVLPTTPEEKASLQN